MPLVRVYENILVSKDCTDKLIYNNHKENCSPNMSSSTYCHSSPLRYSFYSVCILLLIYFLYFQGLLAWLILGAYLQSRSIFTWMNVYGSKQVKLDNWKRPDNMLLVKIFPLSLNCFQFLQKTNFVQRLFSFETPWLKRVF